MALESLIDLNEINGISIIHLKSIDDEAEVIHDALAAQGKLPYIFIDHTENAISFKIQNGPIKENGVNGCQLDTLVHAAVGMIEYLNNKFPCEENKNALTNFKQGLGWLEERTKNRVKAGVEGTSQNH